MKISNTKAKNFRGFTLIELVIVIAGLSALSSITIPGFLASLKLNKIEEAKALMNGYASDCLGQFRISTDPVDFVENAVPDQLDNKKLETLGYKIDGKKNKCSLLGITPKNDKDDSLYAFDFSMTSEGKILKTATPSDNRRMLNSCRGWAGKNCGLSPAQKAEFARLAALAKAKAECTSAYTNWLDDKGSGNFTTWDKDTESCTKVVWAFQGMPVNSEEAFKKAREAQFGQKCKDWWVKNRKKKRISPKGKPETITECAGENFWFHSGRVFRSQTEWDSANLTYQSILCKKDVANAKKKKKKGEFTPRPTSGPDPCGRVIWLCGSKTYTTLDAYKTSSCGKPKKKETKKSSKSTKKVLTKKKKPSRCASFKPHRSCGVFIKKSSPLCNCK